MTSFRPFSSILLKLESENTSDVYSELVKLRTDYLKSEKNILEFAEKGGLNVLMRILQKPHKKSVDITLSILGNCCLKETVRLKVQQLNGMKHVMNVLKNIDVESIQNRACRTLANIIIGSTKCIEELHNLDITATVVELLKKTESQECQQTYIRTLRILGEDARFRHKVEETEAMVLVVECLKVEHEGLQSSALKAVATFTDIHGKWCSEQVVNADGVTILVELTKYSTQNIATNSLLCLHNLAKHNISRQALGPYGAIQCFIDQINSDDTTALQSIHSLCLCCRDAVNRIEIRKCNALKLLLTLLESEEYHSQQSEVFMALLCFLYDDVGLKVLLSNGLVAVLVRQLGKCIGDLKKKEDKIEEEKILAECKTKTEINMNSSNEFTKVLNTKEMDMITKVSAETILTNTSSGSIIHKSASDPWLCIDDVPHVSPRSEISYTSPDWSPQHSSSYACGQSIAISVTTTSPCYPMETLQWSPGASPSEYHWSPIHMNSPTWSADQSQSPGMLFPGLEEEPHYSSTEDEADTDDELDIRDKKVGLASCRPKETSKNHPKLNLDLSYPLDVILPTNLKETESFPDTPNIFEVKSLNLKDPLSIKEQTVLILLSRISQMDDPSEYLVTVECAQVLVDYAATLHHPCNRWYRILNRVCSNPLCIEGLIKTRIPVVIHNTIERCLRESMGSSSAHLDILQERCHAMLNSIVVQSESSYGQGTISHLLLTADIETKNATVVCLPYIIKRKAIRRNMLFELGGLSLMLDIVEEQGLTMKSAVASMSLMCKSMSGKALAPDVVGEKQSCQHIESLPDHDVTFVVEGGGMITAQRSVMTRSCTMFAAMLEGYYAESKQTQVALSDISLSAANTITHFLHGCRHGCVLVEGTTNTLPLDLEILALSDRYLLEELQTFVSTCIYRRHFCADNLPEIYNFSMVHGCSKLAKECILYVLTENLSVRDKLKVFRELMESPYKANVRDVISNIIREIL